ncbi:hypothetical protein BJX70DRAFT_393415 [Aspergillus crustosus]
MALWGLITICQGFVQNKGGLIACRFLIGMFEAGFLPGWLPMPSSVYWISNRDRIPILTIVLNNKGWNAPRRSMLLVHPDGIGSTLSNNELNISVEPSPDYSGIARAASDGAIHAVRVKEADKLESVLREAIGIVQSGTTTSTSHSSKLD